MCVGVLVTVADLLVVVRWVELQMQVALLDSMLMFLLEGVLPRHMGH